MSEKKNKNTNKPSEKEKEVKDENVKEENPCEEIPADEATDDEKEKILKQLDEANALAAEYKDKWYRTAAEFENYKKRNAETRKNALAEGKMEVIQKILFIGDNVERALGYSLDEGTKEGLNLLLRQYGEVLTNLGLEVIDPVGQPFDPNLHEAIFSKDAEEGQESGIVDSVFLKGYKMGDKIIRYAQVVVIK